MVSILFEWTLCHRPPIRHCIAYSQNGPPTEFLWAVTSFMSSLNRDPCHLRPVRVIQSIDGDPFYTRAYQKHLWDGPWLSCPLGSAPRIHASTEALYLVQNRESFTQRTERGAILPIHAVGPKENLAVAARHPHSAGVGSFLRPTSSCLRPQCCSAKSGVRQRQPAI